MFAVYCGSGGSCVLKRLYDVVLKISFLSCDCVCNYYHTTQICSCKRLSSTLLKRYLCCCARMCVCVRVRVALHTPHQRAARDTGLESARVAAAALVAACCCSCAALRTAAALLRVFFAAAASMASCGCCCCCCCCSAAALLLLLLLSSSPACCCCSP